MPVVEIHDQKSDITENIDPAQFGVELDTVEQRHLVINQRYISEVKVSMALTYGAPLLPAQHQRHEPLVFGLCPLTHPFQLFDFIGDTQERTYMLEIFTDPVVNSLCLTEWSICRCYGRVAVKIGNALHQLVDMPDFKLSLLRQLTQQTARGKLPHTHCIFQYRSVTAGPRILGRPGNSDNIQIDLRSEAAVKAQLLVAIKMPFFQGGIIKETEVDRLFELVHELTGQEDRRDVGLEELYLFDRVWVEGWIGKGLDELDVVDVAHTIHVAILGGSGQYKFGIRN